MSGIYLAQSPGGALLGPFALARGGRAAIFPASGNSNGRKPTRQDLQGSPECPPANPPFYWGAWSCLFFQRRRPLHVAGSRQRCSLPHRHPPSRANVSPGLPTHHLGGGISSTQLSPARGTVKNRLASQAIRPPGHSLPLLSPGHAWQPSAEWRSG